jgi:AraC-like DNA-binding protein
MVTLDQAGLARDTLVIRPPPPELAHVVEFLWLDTHTSSRSTAGYWRIVPDDAPHVIYARFTDRDCRTDRHRLHVVGARRHYVDIDCRNRLVTAGARLRPGALSALFRISAAELTDVSVPADWLARRSARETLTRLEDEPASRATDQVMSFLSVLTRRGVAPDDRARWLTTATPRTMQTIRDVAMELGIGERALHAWAMSHLGIGVKRFLTVRRLHSAIAARLADRTSTWSRIAALVGYADQSHLVRDCHALLGESPNAFLSRAD